MTPPAATELRDELPIAGFRPEGPSTDGDLDMTPMVDVTFLLLIFFMLTAAYSLQKSIQVPTPKPEEAAAQRTLQDVEQDDDYAIVEIRADDMIFVDEVAAPSEQELLIKLRDLCQQPLGPSSMLVLAHPECHHEAVVMVLDAGSEVGMAKVELSMQEDEY